jgi:FkbH-like protein
VAVYVKRFERIKLESKEITVHFLRDITLEPISRKLKNYGKIDNHTYEVTFSNYQPLDEGFFNISNKIDNIDPEYIFGFIWIDYSRFHKPSKLLEYLNQVVELAKLMPTKSIFLNNLIPYSPAKGLKPNASEASLIDLGNQELYKLSKDISNIVLINLNAIIDNIGLNSAYDVRFWYMFKQPFTNLFFDELAKEIHLKLTSPKINQVKVIVLDCDNTLWGGVVGEEGPTNIRIGDGAFPGNAYKDFQLQIKRLKELGILLAINSKNNESDVIEVFEKNQNMCLKYEDFVTTRINWDDKAKNILSISKELNLSLESFLFIDDSKFEIENIRKQIPEIQTYQIPEDRFKICKSFEKIVSNFDLNFSQTSSLRLESYKAEKIRQGVKSDYSNLDDFLNTLQIDIKIDKLQSVDINRSVELIQRTNQFNSTGEKLSMSEFKAKLISENCEYITLRASDKYGDYGLVGLASINNQKDFSEIDSFMLSCRILGRKVEHAFLHEIIRIYLPRKIVNVRFRFIENSKNKQVREFLDTLGFEKECSDTFSSNRISLLNMLKYPENYTIEIGSK